MTRAWRVQLVASDTLFGAAVIKVDPSIAYDVALFGACQVVESGREPTSRV